MPVLKNVRHEKFAQGLARGKTAEQALADAGYKRDRRNTTRLTTKPDIQARVAELQSRGAEKAEISIAWWLKENQSLYEECRDGGDHTGANSVLERLGKSLGAYEKDNSQAKAAISVNIKGA